MKGKPKPKKDKAMTSDYGVAALGVARPDGTIPVLEETMVAGVKRVRNHSVILQWLDAGIIETRHRDAVDAFEADYRDAHLMPGYKSCLAALVRVDGGGGHITTDRYEKASRRASQAMRAMGLRGSSAITSVVCEGKSLSHYAAETGTHREVIKGVMLGALDVLVVVYRKG